MDISRRAIELRGQRRPTEPGSPPRWRTAPGRRRRTTVSGPGQYRSNRTRARSSTKASLSCGHSLAMNAASWISGALSWREMAATAVSQRWSTAKPRRCRSGSRPLALPAVRLPVDLVQRLLRLRSLRRHLLAGEPSAVPRVRQYFGFRSQPHLAAGGLPRLHLRSKLLVGCDLDVDGAPLGQPLAGASDDRLDRLRGLSRRPREPRKGRKAARRVKLATHHGRRTADSRR